jgi:hypothetical protein
MEYEKGKAWEYYNFGFVFAYMDIMRISKKASVS